MNILDDNYNFLYITSQNSNYGLVYSYHKSSSKLFASSVRVFSVIAF